MAPQPIPLNLCVEFIDVVPHAQQKKLDFYFDFSAGQKSVETVVMFQHSEGSFDLDRTVHPIPDPLFTRNVFQGYRSFLNQYLRHIQLLFFFGAGTFSAKMRASAAILTSVYILSGFIHGNTGLFPLSYIPQDPALGTDVAVCFFNTTEGRFFGTCFSVFY